MIHFTAKYDTFLGNAILLSDFLEHYREVLQINLDQNGQNNISSYTVKLGVGYFLKK
jgi:hypothetical protein